MTKSNMAAREWKEKGNEEFKKGNWSAALNNYTNALKLIVEEYNAEKAVYLKNRAAAYLKLCDYGKVIKDCNDALGIRYNDPEALFYRCQALEDLARFEEAHLDAILIIIFDPDNKVIEPVAARLHKILQKRCKENTSISAKVSEIIELIRRDTHYTALDWAKRLAELDGLQRLIEVTNKTEKCKYESSMNITSSTQTVTGVCLATIYENLNLFYYVKHKNEFINAIDKFIEDKFLSSDIESKVRVVVAITTLILGPLDVADAFISKKGIVEIILAMSKTDDVLQQKVVCECIVAAATKYNEANEFIRQGVNILGTLCKSKDDSIRIRALVGLCKLSRFKIRGKTRYETIKPFADGRMNKVAEVFRHILINPKKEKGMRKWAITGLSYLTIDVEVKEKFIKNRLAVQVMIELVNTSDQSVLYGVVMTLVNLCNAYDDKELIPEMKDVLTFCTLYDFFTEDIELNDDKLVNKRRCALVKAGVTNALVSLAKTDSQNIKELVARVFNAICGQRDLREIVVQQGGAKALWSLALDVDGTDKGKKYASLSLVHLGLTIRLEFALPEQKIMDVVRPILNLLLKKTNCSFNEKWEILEVLCKLTKVNDNIRKQVLREAASFLLTISPLTWSTDKLASMEMGLRM